MAQRVSGSSVVRPVAVQGKHYPDVHKYPDYQHYEDLRVAYDHIYKMQTAMDGMAKELADLKSGAAGERGGADTGTSQSGSSGGGDQNQKGLAAINRASQKRSISATHIGGIIVKATIPTDGQVLTYRAQGNQIIWT